MEERAQSLQALQALLIDIESEADSGNAVERSDARPASRERSFSREMAWSPPGSHRGDGRQFCRAGRSARPCLKQQALYAFTPVEFLPPLPSAVAASSKQTGVL